VIFLGGKLGKPFEKVKNEFFSTSNLPNWQNRIFGGKNIEAKWHSS